MSLKTFHTRHPRSFIATGALFVALTLLSGVYFIYMGSSQSHAANLADFNAGNIMSDSVFFDAGTMSVSDIQQFLNSKIPSCNTAQAGYTGGSGTVYNPPWICLNKFYENPSATYSVSFNYTDTSGNPQTGTRTYYPNNDYTYTSLSPIYVNGDYKQGIDHLTATISNINGVVPQGAISAAQIIYNISQQYGINPQVLIVLLQKEQGLVTDTSPAPWEYQSAVGYGCADLSPCTSNYAGFSNQLSNAAWQFKQYYNNPTAYSYQAGRNNTILYNPISACGSSSIYIQNKATAGLYNYTPYQPNIAALSSGYGLGDSCSSYGNRNFWLYFTDWFGPTVKPTSNIDIPNGIYSLQNQHSSTFLNVAGGSTSAGAKIWIYRDDGTASESWNIHRNPDGYYTLRNLASNNYLDVTGGSLDQGTPLQSWTGNGTCSQEWAAVYQNASYEFLNACSGLAVDVSGGGTADTTPVQAWNNNRSTAQNWNLIARDSAPLKTGFYSLTDGSGLAMDTANSAGTSGALAQISSPNTSSTQVWQLTRQPDASYTLRHAQSGFYLGVVNASVVSGSNIQLSAQDTATCAQKWHIAVNGNATYTLISSCSGLAIDITGGALNTSGTPLQIYAANGTGSQNWTLTASQSSLPTSTYSVQSLAGLSLDITSGNMNDGTKTQLWNTNGTVSQQWQITHLSDGNYSIINPVSGKSLDVTGGSISSPGTRTQVWPSNSTCSQEWNITQNPDTTYVIHPACSSLALDMAWGGISSPGTATWLWPANGTGSQKWVFGNP